MDHRGRFQAQSDTLEESEPWARSDPLYTDDAHTLLRALENKIDMSEYELRRAEFQKAHRYIDQAAPHGAVGRTSKSFVVRQRRDGSRVDIEVHKGLAFVPRPE